MPKDTKTLGNSKARACESLGFVHKKGCARVLTQPPRFNHLYHYEKSFLYCSILSIGNACFAFFLAEMKFYRGNFV